VRTAIGGDEHSNPRFRVLIAGGGIAALEAMLALRELAGDLVAVELLAPDPKFRFRPLSVTEPFGLGDARALDLAELALANHSSFTCDGLARVDAEARLAITGDGREIPYDALLVATGASGVEAVPGALTFRDTDDDGAGARFVDELDRGDVRSAAFAVPGGLSWPLGLYELALLTAARAQDRSLDVALTLVTPESRPMEIFGRRASGVVTGLLDQAGIEVRTRAKPLSFADGRLELEGGSLACERVVSLPAPRVGPLPGLPQRPGGFIPVDRYGAVLGVERVFAAGDATWFPVKQGGIATQMADCAANSIARLAGAEIEPEQFHPVLRGALLTSWGPRYLRAPVGAGESDSVSKSVLWWPPGKVAGRYLTPFLAGVAGYRGPAKPLRDLTPPPGEDPLNVASGHEDAVAMSLESADAAAGEHDYKGAMRWLEVAEDLELYLPTEYELKRISWQELAGG